MKKTIRVMMVEDHPDYRDTVSMALEDEPDIELVSMFGTAERALQSLKERPRRIVPDVILLDLNLPGISGFEALPDFHSCAPQARIIVLTQSDREADVLRAISGGASGYLLKRATLDQITEGIRTVMDGGASLDAGIARCILDTLQEQLPQKEPSIKLSNRESEILALLGEGLLKKQIADQLNISIPTVATHIRHIYEKLHVQNAPAAITQAYRAGILPNRDTTPPSSGA